MNVDKKYRKSTYIVWGDSVIIIYFSQVNINKAKANDSKE